MKTRDFYFDLPEAQIAQTPIANRDKSKLMIIHKETDKIEHKLFCDIVDYIAKGDCIVINDTKVIPARLMGKRKQTGGEVEVLLLERKSKNAWEALVSPGKKMRLGQEVIFSEKLSGKVIKVLETGNRIIEFIYDGIFEEILDEVGEMPLPPYITKRLEDKNRYQTIYAKYAGSAAAPTAGLHFTDEIIKRLEKKGVIFAKVTLHVGLGTFRPVKAEDVKSHIMHKEYYSIDKNEANKINKAKQAGKRIIAVGTTSVRTLEANTIDGKLLDGTGYTDIFIYPGYQFKLVDAIITNFHLPSSTLLMLVSAFYDREKILSAYNLAVKENYRFFSFGDAMFIVK